jgi:hypothetical protein
MCGIREMCDARTSRLCRDLRALPQTVACRMCVVPQAPRHVTARACLRAQSLHIDRYDCTQRRDRDFFHESTRSLLQLLEDKCIHRPNGCLWRLQCHHVLVARTNIIVEPRPIGGGLRLDRVGKFLQELLAVVVKETVFSK